MLPLAPVTSFVERRAQVEQLAEMQPTSPTNSLRRAERPPKMGDKLLDRIDAVLDGPGLHGGEGDVEPSRATPPALAVIALRAVNADKDTLQGHIKRAVVS